MDTFSSEVLWQNMCAIMVYSITKRILEYDLTNLYKIFKKKNVLGTYPKPLIMSCR